MTDSPGSLVPDLARRVGETLSRAVVGHDDIIRDLLVAVLARGHVLLEGVPGTAKTLLVKALSIALGLDFRRVQMTPDLMPSDIVGTNVFDLQAHCFELRKGPIFTSVLLADEINRSPAKTQSALLEGMQERQATVDGVRYPLPADFTVFATQNPVEFEGTYPLPEAQLDRFLFKLIVPYPTAEAEDELLLRYHQGFDADDLQAAGVTQVTSSEEISQARAQARQLAIEPPVLSYIGQIVRATRTDPNLLLGCSPRAAVMLLLASKATAAVRGRAYVTPDDVKAMVAPTLRHRVILRPEADIQGLSADDALGGALSTVQVPR